MTHEPHIVPTRHDLERMNEEAALARALELLAERERDNERLQREVFMLRHSVSSDVVHAKLTLEMEIELLLLSNNQLHGECGHLIADQEERRQEIEQLQAELSAARALVSRPRAELQAEVERLRGLWLTEQRIRLEQAEFLEMYSAAKAKVKIERLERLLREAVDWLGDVRTTEEAVVLWAQAARAAGGE